MKVALRAPGSQFERRDAAHPERDGRQAGIVDRSIGSDNEVGLQPVAVLAHEIGNVGAADFLLALQQENDVARQFAMHREMRLDGQDLGEVLALVVADAARIDPAIADRGLEGRADPGVQRVRWLNVIMPVEQHRGRAGLLLPPCEHHRVVHGRHGLRFQPQIAQHADEERGHLGNADVLRADAGMADIVHHSLDEAFAVRGDMGEYAVEARLRSAGRSTLVSRGHGVLVSQPNVRSNAPEPCTSPVQPCATNVVASNWLTIAGPANRSPAPSWVLS